MGNPIDMIGKRFGRLTCVKEIAKIDKNRRFQFICDCGGITETDGSSVRNGYSLSCGCLQKEAATAYHVTHGQSGKMKSPEYRTWQNMRTRCGNPNTSNHETYGGRGIRVCDRWLHSFANFYADMGERPGPEYSIDRIHNNGDYEPGNCRWATDTEQARNKSDNTLITRAGITKTLAGWAEHFGMRYGLLFDRIYRDGLSFEEAVSKPKKLQISVTYKEETMTLSEWSKRLGFDINFVRNRMSAQKMSFEEAISKPPHRPRKPYKGGRNVGKKSTRRTHE